MTPLKKSQAHWLRNICRITASIVTLAAFTWAPRIVSAREPISLEIKSQPQIVKIDERFALFEAQLFVGENGQADGFIKLIFANGDSFEFRALLAIQETSDVPQQGKPLLIIAEEVEGEAFEHRHSIGIVLTVTPRITGAETSVSGDDYLIWQFRLGDGAGVTPVGEDFWDIIDPQFLPDSSSILTEGRVSLTTHDFPRSKIDDADLNFWQSAYGEIVKDWDDGYWFLDFGDR